MNKTADMVNHPSYYNQGSYEVIDVIEDWGLCFHLGSAVKYIGRAGYKHNLVEDLEKACWYIRRKIELIKQDPTWQKTHKESGSK